MICPNCHQNVLSFKRWLLTLNPFRVVCAHCDTKLKARPIAYLWTALHLLFIPALFAIWTALHALFPLLFNPPGFGVIYGPPSAALKLAVAISVACLLFVTAYLIPFFVFRRLYEKAD